MLIILGIITIQSCTKNFDKFNTDPNSSPKPVPGYLFTKAEYDGVSNMLNLLLGTMQYTTSFNDVAGFGSKYVLAQSAQSSAAFSNSYQNQINELVEVLKATSADATQSNLVAEARIWRKRYGGGMRQVGILAAAGLHALEHHLERLADDHARARRFADACADAAPGTVDPATVETNIVVLDVGAAGLTATQFVDALLAKGVRTYAVGPRAVRLVWHLDVDDAGTDAAVAAAREVLAAA